MKILKWIGVIFIGLAGAASLGLFLLARNVTSSDIQALLDQEIRAATGRPLAIDGDVKIIPGLVPTIEVSHVSLGNAAWSKSPIMLRAERLSSQIALLSLLEGHLQFEEISLDGVSLFLETDAEGRNNWDLEGSQNAVDATQQPLPSLTPSDQVRDILASLLSLAGHFDKINIQNLSVQYLKAGKDTPRMFMISEVELLAADQDNSLTLDLTGGGAKAGQTLQIELSSIADFLAGQEDLGLFLKVDALQWTSRMRGTLHPEAPATFINLDVAVKSEDMSVFYTNIGEAIDLPTWPPALEPLSLDLKSRVSGSLKHPALEILGLKLDGEKGSKVRAEGRIEDLFGQGALNGTISSTLDDPFQYGSVFLDDDFQWSKLKDLNYGPLIVKGDLIGRLAAPVLAKGSVSWGRTDQFRAESQNLNLGLHPLSVSTDLSVRGTDNSLLHALASDRLAPALADIFSSFGEVALNARLQTSPAGLLNAETIEASLGIRPAMHVALSGNVGDLLGRIDPSLSITLKAEKQLYIRNLISVFAPDDIPVDALSLAPLEATGLLNRTEAGSLAFSDAKLEFGDPEVYRITATGSVADLEALSGIEVNGRLEAKDGPGLRKVVSAVSPETVLKVIPDLDRIDLSVTAQPNGTGVTLSNLTLSTGGRLPLALSGRGDVSLDPKVGFKGRVSIEGPDMGSLRETVSQFLFYDKGNTTLPGTAENLPLVAFQIVTDFTAENDRLTLSGLEAGFANSRFTTNIQATNLAERPQVQVAVPSASLHLSDIDFLLGLDDAPPPSNPEDYFFRQQPYEFSSLTDFDMGISFRGELIGKGGPVLEKVNMDLMLSQGKIQLNHFRGETVNGNLSLSGNWNAAGAGDPEMAVDLAMNGISLGTLLQRTEIADWLREAPLSGTVQGALRGLSPSALAASFTGGVRLTLGPGQIDKKMLDWLGGDLISNLYTTINPFSKTLPYSQLECGESRLNFVNGLASFEKGIAVETRRVALIADGQIDLARETLDLSFASSPKEGFGPTIGGSGTLARLKGRLNDPKISMDEWSLSKRALSVGASFLTSGISTLMETMLDRMTRKISVCQAVASPNGTQK